VTIPQSIGNVDELWRYPVKSMAGEQCELLQCDLRGVEGDRWFAIRDASGRFGSGKNTRRFRKIDGLLEFQSSYVNGVARIRFPGGEVRPGESPSIHAALTDALGQPVVLVREAEISHLDAGSVHIVTSASLAWLRAALPGGRVDARRFRPNLVIDVPDVGHVEQQWVGMRLRVGEQVQFEVTGPTERCGMVALAQSDLPAEPSVLRCITEQAGLTFGVYAKVVSSGVIRRNDTVTLSDRKES
jgi:uncharacterized protein YcbX